MCKTYFHLHVANFCFVAAPLNARNKTYFHVAHCKTCHDVTSFANYFPAHLAFWILTQGSRNIFDKEQIYQIVCPKMPTLSACLKMLLSNSNQSNLLKNRSQFALIRNFQILIQKFTQKKKGKISLLNILKISFYADLFRKKKCF